MILEAERLGCLREVLVIAAALSLQDPRERPVEQRPQADQQHARFKDERQRLPHLAQPLAPPPRAAARALLVGVPADVQAGVPQLPAGARVAGLRVPAAPGLPRDADRASGRPADTPDADGIHQALLSGLLSHVGLLEERDRKDAASGGPREYLGARGTRFAIFPGSGLKGKNPQFLMAGELVETGRLWARQNAAIKPEWAERIGSHLVKRSYSEPHWSQKRGGRDGPRAGDAVRRPAGRRPARCSYGRIDAALARELFIRHALVYGEWHTRHRFFADNRRLLEEAEELEHRARRRDLVVDEHTLFDFYDARIPEDVVSGAHFDQWWKQERRHAAGPADLRPGDADPRHRRGGRARPTTPSSGSSRRALTFPISYHFEPGAADDGITIDVPVATLNRVAAEDFSWNVPGLRAELVTSLLRSLPKQLRVSFVPAPNTAREFLAAVPPRARSRCSTPSSATCAVARPASPSRARRGTGRRSPSTCARPTACSTSEGGSRPAARTSRSSRSRCAAQFAAAMAEVAADTTATGRTTLDLRDGPRRADLAAGRPRRARLPRARRRGRHGRAAGVRVGRRGRRAAPRRRRPAAAARPARGPTCWPGSTTPTKLGLAGSPYASVADLVEDVRRAVVLAAVDARAEVRDEAAYDALLADLRATSSRGCASCSAPVGQRAGPLARHRQVAGRPGRPGRARLAHRHARPARPAGPPRLRRRGGARAAAALPGLPRRARPAARAARRAAGPRPAAARAGGRPAGGVPPPGRRAARGAAALGRAARGAVAARGVPGLAVGPAARHGAEGQRPARSAKPWPPRPVATASLPA